MKFLLYLKIERNIVSGSRILSGSNCSEKSLRKKPTEKEKMVKFLQNTSSDIQVISIFNRTLIILHKTFVFHID